jgi:hypothetical protein
LVEGDQYSNLFILGGRYRAADYMRVMAAPDPFHFLGQQHNTYRPAQREGY